MQLSTAGTYVRFSSNFRTPPAVAGAVSLVVQLVSGGIPWPFPLVWLVASIAMFVVLSLTLDVGGLRIDEARYMKGVGMLTPS